MSDRFEQLSSWLMAQLRLPVQSIVPLAGDASFRRYYRVILPDCSYIVMDAPPEKENCRPFVAIASQFIKAGIHAPAVVEQDLEQGFLLLEDMGDTVLLAVLDQTTVDVLYRQALQVLVRLQQIKRVEGYTLPQFDRAFMLREMKLFTDWFLKGKLGLTLSPVEQDLIDHTFNAIADRVERQPYFCVHRDYHARNLMLLDNDDIGVLDFQDAVWGPVTYDAISLLKDCYVVWPREKVVDLVGYYHQLASAAGLLPPQTLTDFLRDFDWMGIQRHIKVIGIFSRLSLRDQKSGYLKDIPVAMRYLTEALGQFGEFMHFNNWMQARVMPIYQELWSLANV